MVTVVAQTAWLRTDDGLTTRVVEVSYGTRLPVLGESGSWVRVALPGAVSRRVSASAVARHSPGSAAVPPTGPAIVQGAQSFAGLPYLWAGRSGFGFDCSGLTSLVFRVHGITIPRDADAQAAGGAPTNAVPRAPGDLLFYATARGYVHHVSIYAGDGLMVQSPSTGGVVETIPTATPPYAAQYAGARRYLP
jgi:cell wall-associated NlpC family hydrolase